MPTIESADGVKIAYRVSGSGARTVLLLHGWMVSGAVFDDLLEQLDATGVKFVVPDHRGSGGSDRPASGYELEHFARDVLAIAAQESQGPVVIIGHSMGGQLAKWIAAMHPAETTKLAASTTTTVRRPPVA